MKHTNLEYCIVSIIIALILLISLFIYKFSLVCVLKRKYKLNNEQFKELKQVTLKYCLFYFLLLVIPVSISNYQDFIQPIYYLINWRNVSLFLFNVVPIFLNSFLYSSIYTIVKSKERFKLWYTVTIIFTIYWFFAFYWWYFGVNKTELFSLYLIQEATILVSIYNVYTKESKIEEHKEDGEDMIEKVEKLEDVEKESIESEVANG